MDLKAKFGLMAAAILLWGCNVPPPQWQIEQAKVEQRDREILARYMGRQFWTSGGASFLVCPQRMRLVGCDIARGQLTVDSFEGVGVNDHEAYLHVSFIGGPSGLTQVDPQNLIFYLQDRDPLREPSAYPSFILNPKDKKSAQIAAERRNLPGIMLGMREDAVWKSAWGEPDNIKSKETLHDFHEWWFYPDHNILYFRNGILVEIEKL